MKKQQSSTSKQTDKQTERILICSLVGLMIAFFINTSSSQEGFVRAIGSEIQRERITYFDFTPDGQYLVAATQDGVVGLEFRDIETYEVVDTLSYPESYPDFIRLNAIHYFDLSEDGKKILLGNISLNAHIWDTQKKEIIFTLGPYEHISDPSEFNSIGRVELSPNAEWALVRATQNDFADLWNVEKQESVKQFPFPHILSFLSNMKYIVYNFEIIDFEGRENIREFVLDIGSAVRTAVDFGLTKDGNFIVYSENHYRPNQHFVSLWDFNSGELIYLIEGFQSNVGSIELSPDESILAIVALNEENRSDLYLWDFEKQKLLSKSPHIFGDIKFSPDGKYLFGFSDLYPNQLTMWDVEALLAASDICYFEAYN